MKNSLTIQERNVLFKANMYIAKKVLGKFSGRVNNRDLERLDILQEAYVSLWQATEEYTSKSKYKFSTFAYQVILHDLLNVFKRKGFNLIMVEVTKKYDNSGDLLNSIEPSFSPDYENEIFFSQVKKLTYNLLNKYQRNCFWAPICDKTWKQLGEMKDVSRQRAQQVGHVATLIIKNELSQKNVV